VENLIFKRYYLLEEAQELKDRLSSEKLRIHAAYGAMLNRQLVLPRLVPGAAVAGTSVRNLNKS
jgi:hypothetical protein